MKITNITKDKIIANNAVAPKGLIAQSIGLIGAKKPYALVLNTSLGVHTFGVRFPVDILVLDKDDKVVSIKENLAPFRIFVWNPRFSKVIELAAGTIKKTKTSVGDKLSLND